MNALDQPSAADPLGEVLRWEIAGGSWRTEPARGDQVAVVLCRCDGGEVVGRVVSDDPELRVYTSARPTSED